MIVRGGGGVDEGALPRYPDGSEWRPSGDLLAGLRDSWATPAWVLSAALAARECCGGPPAREGFGLDPASRPGTAAWDLCKVRRCGVPGGSPWSGDGLAVPWAQLATTVWLNFPFNDPPPWVAAAVAAAIAGCWVTVLAPHTTGAWWDDLRQDMRAEVPLRRVEFDPCPGLLDAAGAPATGNKPSQQCSLVVLAPGASRPSPTRPRALQVAGRRVFLLPGVDGRR